MPCFHNIWSFKIPILAFLKKNRMFVDRYSPPMHDVQTTDIGWYSNNHHPETIDVKQVQTELNNAIEKHFASNKESLSSGRTIPMIYKLGMENTYQRSQSKLYIQIGEEP